MPAMIVLSVALAAGFVNAAEPLKAKSKALTWDALARSLAVEGGYKDEFGSLFDPPPGAIGKCVDLDSIDALDGKEHSACLALDPAETPPKRLFFTFSTNAAGHFPNERNDAYFRLSLNGLLEKIVLGRIKLDEAGKSISGTGVSEVQDINSPRAKELFQKEAAFWLRGIGRKKPLPKQAAAGAAAPSKQ